MAVLVDQDFGGGSSHLGEFFLLSKFLSFELGLSGEAEGRALWVVF